MRLQGGANGVGDVNWKGMLSLRNSHWSLETTLCAFAKQTSRLKLAQWLPVQDVLWNLWALIYTFETDTQNPSSFSTAGKGQSTLTNTYWNPTYYMPSLVVGQTRGSSCPQETCSALWETMWWGLFRVLFTPMVEHWTQSNMGQLPGWCSFDMQKTNGIPWGKFYIEPESQGPGSAKDVRW